MARECRGLLIAGRTAVRSDGGPERVRKPRHRWRGRDSVCILELSGEPFNSITTLPLEFGDLECSDDGRGPSRSAV